MVQRSTYCRIRATPATSLPTDARSFVDAIQKISTCFAECTVDIALRQNCQTFIDFQLGAKQSEGRPHDKAAETAHLTEGGKRLRGEWKLEEDATVNTRVDLPSKWNA